MQKEIALSEVEQPPPASLAGDLQTVPDLFQKDLSRPAFGEGPSLPIILPEKIVQNRPVSHQWHNRGWTNNPQTRKLFLKTFFPGISQLKWNSWIWQLRNRIRDSETLSRFLGLRAEEKKYFCGEEYHFPLSITPHYLSLLDPFDPDDPLRKTVVPTFYEKIISREESCDPLGEEHDSPVPGLVHRYPDRVLFLATHFCSTYCRYCTRSRVVSHPLGHGDMKRRWLGGLKYIREHKEVRDVLISGGDPLTLTDESLEWLLKELRAIKHVEILRIGTKVPVVLPQRITNRLVSILKKYHPLYMNIHFSHPREIGPETARACRSLAGAGIPLGSQTVLLAGVNDNLETIRSLMHELLKVQVKPYYLYQCDLVHGTSHFRTPLAKGLEIIEGLRGHTSGLAVPTFVIDAADGAGKIPLIPEYVTPAGANLYRLRNYKRQEVIYPDKC